VGPALRALRNGLGSVGYGELLDTPGSARAHDLQRLVSYGLGISVALIVTMPAWRTAAVLGITSSLLLLALIRIVTARKTAPYPVALTDLALTGVAVALATSSLVITLEVLAFVTSAIAMTFKVTPRLP
jgi:hypothetical protein